MVAMIIIIIIIPPLPPLPLTPQPCGGWVSWVEADMAAATSVEIAWHIMVWNSISSVRRAAWYPLGRVGLAAGVADPGPGVQFSESTSCLYLDRANRIIYSKSKRSDSGIKDKSVCYATKRISDMTLFSFRAHSWNSGMVHRVKGRFRQDRCWGWRNPASSNRWRRPRWWSHYNSTFSPGKSDG